MTPKRLSEAQRRVMTTGEIVGWFDVWGGYWWTCGANQEPVRKSTIDKLFYGRLIEKGETTRIYSGRHRTRYTITDAGRAALAGEG